jgi:hypothetical protein
LRQEEEKNPEHEEVTKKYLWEVRKAKLAFLTESITEFRKWTEKELVLQQWTRNIFGISSASLINNINQ